MTKVRVTPKVHFLEDHCIPWISNYGFGLGLHSEHGGELLHRSIREFEIQAQGVRKEEDKMVTVIKKHFMQIAPELSNEIPSPKKRKLN